VPLYAIIQSRSGEDKLAGATACCNITDSAFMAVSSLAAAAMLRAGAGSNAEKRTYDGKISQGTKIRKPARGFPFL
jgi:hypothetical protein